MQAKAVTGRLSIGAHIGSQYFLYFDTQPSTSIRYHQNILKRGGVLWAAVLLAHLPRV